MKRPFTTRRRGPLLMGRVRPKGLKTCEAVIPIGQRRARLTTGDRVFPKLASRKRSGYPWKTRRIFQTLTPRPNPPLQDPFARTSKDSSGRQWPFCRLVIFKECQRVWSSNLRFDLCSLISGRRKTTVPSSSGSTPHSPSHRLVVRRPPPTLYGSNAPHRTGAPRHRLHPRHTPRHGSPCVYARPSGLKRDPAPSLRCAPPSFCRSDSSEME